MKKMMVLGGVILGIAIFTSCTKEKNKPAAVETKTILVNGSSTTGNYFLYSFATGAQVNNTDSASVNWDFAIRFEKIIVNSNASGLGAAKLQLVDGTFDTYHTAPDAGYAYDTTNTQLAVKGSQWYNYDAVTRTFSPKAGKIFVFKTNAGNYAKMEILSADPTDDNGNIVTSPTRPTKIKYTIRQAVQTNGTKFFN